MVRGGRPWTSDSEERRRPALVLVTAVVLVSLVSGVQAIAHDSLLCEATNSCRDVSHTVLKLHKRDDALARQIALDHGMVVKGSPFLDSHYFVQHDASLSRRRKREVVDRLSSHPDVHSVIEDRPRTRSKRDYVPRSGTEDVNITRVKREQTAGYHAETKLPVPVLPFPDPLYESQWYLVGKAIGGYDMNVREAWKLGYAGRNVSVSILDDGIQLDHPDLAENYDPIASTDINDHDDDPTPQDNGDNKHGTRCAGEVAAVAGNSHCGVGVAYHAKIGGVRMLDGPVSDSVEAASLHLNQHHIDIYSASWGPEDDGKTFDGPGPLAREAFYRGIKQGRGGRGNIFVWASGNGGSRQDSCSADGYTTSVYTLSISSATFDNHRPWYLEECPSTIATTYSSANINQPAIVTVDVPSGCTKSHTGTSASAPLAAGIIALALEANPLLTWRDMQHIVLRTANPTPLLNNPGWSINGVGRQVSNKFGYGLMDAGALVKLARVWKTVPEQHRCTYEYNLSPPNPRPLEGRFQLNFTLNVNACPDGTPVFYLEHVQVLTTIRFGKRGDLKLTLFSPAGTRSVLLPPRPQDFNTNGFHKWPFLSVQTWGEDPRGTWTLQVESVSTSPKITGSFSNWSLLLYGTQEPAQPTDPKHTRPPEFTASFQQTASGSSTSFVQQTQTSEASSSEPQSTEPVVTIGDVRSVGNCHEECLGCSESGVATACFDCKHFSLSLRNKAGMKCVPYCDDGYYVEGTKCKACSSHCQTCSKAEHCETCHGAQLLIDVNHFGHFDHGQCVDQCPEGLIADYDTNTVQARCILKRNPCLKGYYEDERSNCVACEEACATCHGPSALKCDECSAGYGNTTFGFCRPCCPTDPTAAPVEHCADCTHPYVSINLSHESKSGEHPGFFATMFWSFVMFGIVMGVICCCMRCFGESFSPFAAAVGGHLADMEYTQLKDMLDDDGDDDTDDDDGDDDSDDRGQAKDSAVDGIPQKTVPQDRETTNNLPSTAVNGTASESMLIDLSQ